MNDTRTYLEGIFNGKTPVKRKNKQTGAIENIYYKYDDDLEDLIEIDRPSSSFYGLDEENQSIYSLQIDQYQNIFSEYIPETQELYPTLADQAALMQNFAGKNVSTPQNNSYIDTIKFVNPYMPVMTDATLLLDSIERKNKSIIIDRGLFIPICDKEMAGKSLITRRINGIAQKMRLRII